jgi:hypothetical protein
MTPSDQTRLGTLITEITNLHPTIDGLGKEVRDHIAAVEKAETNNELKHSGSYWTMVAYMDAITRIRLMLEQNFRFIETIGVLSVTRYLFELLVWLRTLHQDQRYGLVYRFQIMQKQIRYYQDYVAKIEREIVIMNTLGEQERSKIEDLAKAQAARRALQADTLSADFIQQFRAEMDGISAETDRKARRSLCIYAEQAKTNGHSFQAHLLETQVLPQLREQLAKCKSQHARALSVVNVRPPQGKWESQDQLWNWKERAIKSGMGSQYEFIYFYTSRLLHATPVSLTTDQKLLEPDEMIMFFEYIYVSILDAVEMTRSLFGFPAVNAALH